VRAPRTRHSIGWHAATSFCVAGAAILLVAGVAGAAGSAPDHRPAVFNCDGGGGLTPEENRVVDWTVERILKLAGNDASTIDITPENIAAGTGVDVQRLDSDRLRDAVARRLFEIAGGGATVWSPEPPPQPGAAAESSCTGVGEAPVEAGGGPTAATGRSAAAQSSRR